MNEDEEKNFLRWNQLTASLGENGRSPRNSSFCRLEPRFHRGQQSIVGDFIEKERSGRFPSLSRRGAGSEMQNKTFNSQ